MKRRMVFSAMLVCLAILASREVYAGGDLKIGLDNSGSFDMTPNGTSKTVSEDVNSGSSMTFEGFTEAGRTLDVGVGLEWQSSRELTNAPSGSGTFNFMPFYLFMRMRPEELSSFSPYLSIQVGIAQFNADDKFKGNMTLESGNHLGIGLGGIMDKKFLMELLMTEDTGSMSYNGTKVADVKYTKTTFSVGLYF